MKINRINQEQFKFIFNVANMILNKYINKDLSQDSTWEELIKDVNEIVKKTFNDCLTEEIMLAIVKYLEQLRINEKPDTPPDLVESPPVQGFKVTGFQITGFKN